MQTMKIIQRGVGEISEWLRILAAEARDRISNPSTHKKPGAVMSVTQHYKVEETEGSIGAWSLPA